MIFLSMAILFNAFIYNLIILPIQTVIMTIKLFTFQSFNRLKYKINLLKILLFIIEIFIKRYLERTYPFFYIQHKLRSLNGIKIFALLKIIEFITTLLNRCHKDYEIQLLTVLQEKKVKRKIISFCLLVFTLTLNIISFWSYMISISITLNDTSNAIYPLFFKINYIELKKCGKPIKKKNIMGTLTTDIYDRFFNYAVFITVIFQNYHENKISSHNFIEYFYRAVFIFFFEIMFDWVKDFIIFRISYFNPKIIKLITYELALYHDKLRYNCYNTNGASKNTKNKYIKYLENKELLIVSRQYHYEKYVNVLGNDSVMCLTLHTNILIYCLMMSSVFFSKVKISMIMFLFGVISLLLVRKILQTALSNYIIKHNRKNNGIIKESLKNDAELYVNDPNKVEVNNYNIHTDCSNGGNGNSSEIYSENMKSKDL